MAFRRYDRTGLRSPEVQANGWLKGEAYIARTGVLEYRRADGSTHREYRPPTAHDDTALHSFDAVPLTNDHPKEGLLTAENTKRYQVGTVSSPKVDEDKVRANVLVTDAATVKAINQGKAELSCGYYCDVDETPGVTPEGVHYDAVQKNVRGNHVAVVWAGRAGPEIRMRVDSLDAEVIPFVPSKETKMHKLNLDGIEFEVEKPIFDAVQKRVAQLEKAVDSEKARADVASGEVTKLKKELADAPLKAQEQINLRVALETSARKVLGEGTKFDGKSDLEVKRAVAETSGVKLDGKSDAYVEAAFEIALANHTDKADAEEVEKKTSPVHVDKKDSARPDIATLKAKFEERSRNAHKMHTEKR
jgi:uncharacterized protein